MIVSNPPYSLKTEVFKRLFELNKPFAMLVGFVGIFENMKRYKIFSENEFEILVFNRRISFMKDYDIGECSTQPPFSSYYVCSKLLPKQIIFEEITKTKYGLSYKKD